MKDIPNYEGYYYATQSGRIFNAKGIEIKARKNNSGYLLLHLNKQGKRKAFTVHRLIALTFIANTENKPQVNHKDGDKLNNSVDNLEWVNGAENARHFLKHLDTTSIRKARSLNMKKISRDKAFIEKRRQTLLKSHHRAKQIKQIDKLGNVIAVYHSGGEARNVTGINNIYACANGRYKSAGGYNWEWC